MHPSALQVVLVDINPDVVEAWHDTFADVENVTIVAGSMLDQTVDAFVTPTNALGRMDGGLDAVLKRHFGAKIEKRVGAAIQQEFDGFLPVGAATCVLTDRASPRYLISTPTMVASSEDVSQTVNVALACAAAFQAIHLQNHREPGSITSVALPGLGAATGQVPVDLCASLMWSGFHLFQDYRFRDFATMRATLMEQLADLAPLLGAAPRRYELPEPDVSVVAAEPAPWICLKKI